MSPQRAIAASLLIGVLLLAAGCTCRRCENERQRLLAGWGQPEERKVERAGHLFTETWFYWDSNRSAVFLWDDRECSCDVSTYIFDDERGEPRALSFRTADPHPLRP